MTARALHNSTRESRLQDAIAEAKERYAQRNPKSAQAHGAARACLPGGNTRTVLHYDPFPLVFVKGEGAFLWSADGHRYSDFLGEYTAGLFGHSHPKIIGALKAALDRGVGFGGHTLDEGRLAALMCERFPSVEMVRFTNSGTEANLMAVSTSVALTGRRAVLVFDGAYHGSVLSFGGGTPLNAPFEFVVARYNDIDGTRSLLRENRDRLAAVLVEPMLGAGGCIPAARPFLAMLREEASSIGANLIFDEVMTSRLSPGGLQASLGIRPDLTTFGKYLAGGSSFGAFGGRRDIMELFDPRRPDAFAHAGTFNNNVLSMAAGVVALAEVFTPAAAAALNALGDGLRSDLNTLFADQGVAMQATGHGSLLTIHATGRPIASAADLRESDQSIKELLFFDLIDSGFWLARRGMAVLSLPTTKADCDRFVAAVADFLGRRRELIPATG